MTSTVRAERSSPLPLLSGVSAFTATSRAYFSTSAFKTGSRGLGTIALAAPQVAMARLATLAENWDGFGSVAPSKEALSNARGVLDEIYATLLDAGRAWRSPLISASEDGSIVMEWWRDDRKITVYVGAQDADYLQVWGEDPSSQMRDGGLEPNRFAILWEWLEDTIPNGGA